MVIHQFNRLIRNKWVWGVFAVAISVFFAFDFLFVGRDDEGRSAGRAGMLAGKEMTAQRFRMLADDERGFGRMRDTQSSNVEINKRAWAAAAALAVAQESHLEASDADVKQAILRDFAGQGGEFSYPRYEALLRENGLTPEMYEAFLQRRITRSKVSQVVLGAATWASPTELEGAINDMTDKFTVRIAAFTDKDFGKVKVSDKDLEAYYKDNTNSIALPDCVTLKYVAFRADATNRLAQFTIAEDELKDHYDATSKRFETTTTDTNGVATTTTKPYEEVKPILERELQLIASLEAYRTNLLFRVYPQDEKLMADTKTDRLEKVAAEEKATVKVSKRLALNGRQVRGFTVSASSVAPDCRDLLSTVAELDADSPDLRYGVAVGTNTVYLIERASFEAAHVPPFAEAKEIIRPDALKEAQAKAFKAAVEKTRAAVAAGLAAGKPFDQKLFGDANVSTSITFAVSGLQRNSFADSMYVTRPTMKLSKGKLSDFITTSNPRRGLVVYVENREPGDAAQAQMLRAQVREDLSRMSAMAVMQKWGEWNLDRMGYETTSMSAVKVEADDESSIPEE